ncbi:hypothetical protein EBR43_11950 [bacterium]|nr:hypothetical protein [bacterium]
MLFSVDNFKQNVLKKGLARLNNFEVVISPPASLAGAWDTRNDISLMCESTTLPQLSISVRPLKIFGPSHQRPHAIEFGGEGLPFTFLVDQNMTQKKFFDQWMASIVDFEQFTVNLNDNYKTTIQIYQLDNQSKRVYAIELLEAFPRSMNMMELNQGSRDQFHRCNVNFTFRRWRPLTGFTNSGKNSTFTDVN